MTTSQLHPIVQASLSKYAITYRVFSCDPSFADTREFCEQYGFRPDQSANAIIVVSKNAPHVFACCVVLATMKLDVNKKVCELLSIKRASFASAEQTRQMTDMEIGGVTIFGIESMPIFVDAAVLNNEETVMGSKHWSLMRIPR